MASFSISTTQNTANILVTGLDGSHAYGRSFVYEIRKNNVKVEEGTYIQQPYVYLSSFTYTFKGLEPSTQYSVYIWIYAVTKNSSGVYVTNYNELYTSWSGYATTDASTSNCYIYTNGSWHLAIPYIYTNGQWKMADSKIYSGGWKP